MPVPPRRPDGAQLAATSTVAAAAPPASALTPAPGQRQCPCRCRCRCRCRPSGSGPPGASGADGPAWRHGRLALGAPRLSSCMPGPLASATYYLRTQIVDLRRGHVFRRRQSRPEVPRTASHSQTSALAARGARPRRRCATRRPTLFAATAASPGSHVPGARGRRGFKRGLAVSGSFRTPICMDDLNRSCGNPHGPASIPPGPDDEAHLTHKAGPGGAHQRPRWTTSSNGRRLGLRIGVRGRSAG